MFQTHGSEKLINRKRKVRKTVSVKMKPSYVPDRRLFEEYYVNQAGNGYPVFAGSRIQRGHGLGSVFSGLFKAATPLLKRGAKALGKKALKTGMELANDLIEGKNFKTAAKDRLKKAGSSLMEEAVGSLRRPPGKRAKKRERTSLIKRGAIKSIYNRL